MSKNILFETNITDDDTNIDTRVDPYSSDEDKMKELDIEILKQLQLRKQKLDKYKKHQNSIRKLSAFPKDFLNDSLAGSIEDNFTEEEKSTLSKLRYDIHRALYKLSKNKKLQRINEISVTYSNYPDSVVSQPMLAKIQGELTSRGFGCEILGERAHTVKHKSRGVIISVIIK